MQVQRALDSYQNYDAMNYYPDALNALIRGLQRYDANLETAKQLEIEDEVDGCKEQIVSLLQSEYGVSESQARELLSLDKAEYTSKVVEIAMKKNTGMNDLRVIENIRNGKNSRFSKNLKTAVFIL